MDYRKKRKVNIFQEKLEEGNKAEKILMKKLVNILFATSVQQIGWDADNILTMNLQRRGIDGLVRIRELKCQVKTRSFFYHQFEDILIETVSVMERNKPGWFYTCKADFIAYVWKDKYGDYFMDGYFIFIQNPLLRPWFEENKKNYRRKIAESVDQNTGEVWHTANRVVPIKDFPKGTILHFNPRTPLDGQGFFEFIKEETR